MGIVGTLLVGAVVLLELAIGFLSSKGIDDGAWDDGTDGAMPVEGFVGGVTGRKESDEGTLLFGGISDVGVPAGGSGMLLLGTLGVSLLVLTVLVMGWGVMPVVVGGADATVVVTFSSGTSISFVVSLLAWSMATRRTCTGPVAPNAKRFCPVKAVKAKGRQGLVSDVRYSSFTLVGSMFSS